MAFKLLNSILSRFSSSRSLDIPIIGVTGSLGKTTTALLLSHILNNSGYKVCSLTTEGVQIGAEKLPLDIVANLATKKDVSKIIKEAVDQEATAIVIETPVTAIKEGAFKNVVFDTVILTNISSSEIATENTTVEEYAELLFSPITQIKNEGLAIVNGDDESRSFVAKRAEAVPQDIYALWCSEKETEELLVGLDGISCKFDGAFYNSKLATNLNVMNMLQGIRAAMKYTGTDNIDSSLLSFAGCPGRLQVIQERPVSVLVDYAYQPSVIKSVLSELRKETGDCKLISIVGMNGGSHESRSRCALYASQLSDLVLLAAQDSRGKDVATLNSSLSKDAEAANAVLVDKIAAHSEFLSLDKGNLKDKLYRVLENSDVPMVSFDESAPSSRYDAITFALDFASPGDMVVVFGKGNDTSLDMGKVIYEWNDVDMVKAILQSRY